MRLNEIENQQTDEVVGTMVRRRVARKVMRDLHQQVDEINQQVQSEKRNARYLLPLVLLLLLALLLLLYVDAPQLARLISSYF